MPHPTRPRPRPALDPTLRLDPACDCRHGPRREPCREPCREPAAYVVRLLCSIIDCPDVLSVRLACEDCLRSWRHHARHDGTRLRVEPL